MAKRIGEAGLGFDLAQRKGAHMPESGLPIRVYKKHDTWHVDYGEGVREDHESEEEAASAADAGLRPKGVPWSSRNRD